MEEIKSTQEGSVNPIENLSGWIEKRDAKEASSAGAVETTDATQAPSAEPTVAEPAPAAQPAVLDWREVVMPDDVDHGFFRGKKVGDLYQSYRHVESAKQQAERERNELRQQLQQFQQQRQQPVQPAADPYAGIENLMFENPAEYTRRVREIAVNEARAAAAQANQEFRQQNQVEREQESIFNNGLKAYDAARDKLGLDEATWNWQAKHVLFELSDQNGRFYGDGQGLFRPDDYVKVHEALFGKKAEAAPAPVVVKAPAPELPPPPGARKAAPANTPTERPSSLNEEDRKARRVLAEIVAQNVPGLTAEKLIKRGERRG